jgi:hypothetical protein
MTLHQLILDACQSIRNIYRTSEMARQSTVRRVCACVGAGGGHIENLLWIVT